ncbi:DUF3039 domain-containing protein, partial [Actinomadura sp. GC306]|uniref:DUF3039 domain-containing protein n=1 Tax=Actinomadura sp. GC306 TaxID=2530367 RepID=UPI0010518DED
LPARLDGASAPASLQLGVYTPEQSATAIGRLLPALSAGERERLAEAIGHHPLVLDRMCRHVLADPEWSLDAMIAALSVDTPGALDAVDSISGAAERLSRIHQRTLEALEAWDPNAVRVLETLVWTADRGEVPKDLADEFLRHRFPGPVGSLSIAAAEITLSRWALVTVEANAFVMHPLTAAVFQRLLADSCQPVLTEFFDFLRGVPLTSEKRLVNLLRGELAVFDGAFPDSWNRVGSWFVHSNSVWLKQGRTGTSDAERYEVFPDSVQATTGPRRHHVTGSELSELLAVTTDYFRAMERLYTTSDALPDAEITEPDGFAHYVRKNAPAVDGVTQARCGKRWRRSSGVAVETLPVCPLCERSWEARVADVVAKPPPPLGYLRRQAEEALRADDADAAAAALERLREAPFKRPFGTNRTAVRQLSEAAFDLLRTPAEEDFVSSAERLRLLGVAETWYRNLAEILPADADIPWRLGQVVVAQEECEESVDAERSRDRYSEAVRHYRRSLELEPDDVDMLLRIDDALHQAAGRVGREESERLYRESEHRLRVSPAAGRGDPKVLARIAFALEMRGFYFLETDPAFADVLLAEAVEWAEASLRAQPDNPTALNFLGRALQRRGRATRALGRPGAQDHLRRAEESFRRSIELAPGIPDPMHDLAETLQLLVDASAAPEVESAAWAAAEGAYAAGLAACPDDPAWLRAWLDGLGWCTYQQARLLEGRDAEGALVLYGKAIDHLTRSLAVERLPHILRNLGTVQVNMAQLMERTGQADAARAFEATAETLRPVLGDGGGADLSLVKQLSYALVHQGNLMRSADPAACDALYAEASGLLARVEERHVWALKLAAEASVGRALIAIDSAPDLAAGYFAEATAPLRRALDLDPGNAHTWRYLAAVLSKRAELVEATDPELAGHLRAQEADLRERSRMPSEGGRR